MSHVCTMRCHRYLQRNIFHEPHSFTIKYYCLQAYVELLPLFYLFIYINLWMCRERVYKFVHTFCISEKSFLLFRLFVWLLYYCSGLTASQLSDTLPCLNCVVFINGITSNAGHIHCNLLTQDMKNHPQQVYYWIIQ